jgi:hypothetical protein
MMRVVHLVHEVGDRELELVGPEAGALLPRRQPMPVAQVLKDGGGLTDQPPAVPQEGRREGRPGDVLRFP